MAPAAAARTAVSTAKTVLFLRLPPLAATHTRAMNRLRLVAGREGIGRAWPAPALLAWGLCWLTALAVQPAWGSWAALAAGTVLGAALAQAVDRTWRRWAVAAGFPVSALALALVPSLPGWVWLLPLLGLVGLYPMRAWRDAPLFPTPVGALDDLAVQLGLPGGARVLDAGCGSGAGLRALRRAWPQARIDGIEWSGPLAAWAALRCRFAGVRRGDMWGASWADYRLVYLFQRPESMAQAWAKACEEMKPGAWLVSLEFVVPGVAADLEARPLGGKPVRAWRVPAQPGGVGADNPPVHPGTE